MNQGRGESAADYEVVVVGAGQAGLAIGYFLAQRGRRFVILDAADSVAAAWRERWDSLTLFTPRRYDSLPGLPFPGDPEGYPTRDEVIAYLGQYVRTFDLPIELNSRVRRLTSENGVLRRRARRADDHGRARCRRDRAVPDAPRPRDREPPRVGGVPDAQHGIPAADRRAGRAPSSWSAEGTRGSRSRRSSPRRTRSSSPSGHGKRRCRRGSSDAISSGG